MRKKAEERTRALNSANIAAMEGSAALRTEFLELITGTPDRPPLSVGGACRELSIVRYTVRRWRKENPDFEAAYADAMESGGDVLEDVAVDRAVKGTLKDVYYLGAVVGQ